MKKYFIFLIAVLIGLQFESCKKQNVIADPGPINFTSTQKKILQSSNEFGFDLFKKMTASVGKDSNLFMSPLSVSMALTMTYNGAAGETQDSMRKVLEFEGLSDLQINEACRDLISALTNADPKVIMEIANSIWYRNNFTVLDSFIQINKDYFDAEVKSTDFSNPATLNAINGWVDTKTQGKIPTIIDNIPGSAVMYLINAIYFKGTWKFQFEASKTQKKTFYLEDNSTFQTDFMIQKGTFGYLSNSEFSAVELPYGDGNFSMIVMVPNGTNSCNDILNELDQENWASWCNSLKNPLENVQISMPKFKFSYKDLLNNELKSMGMSAAFDDQKADFSKINGIGGLYISRVIHKSFVEVNEEGTEAAAATAVEIFNTSMPEQQEYYFTADKPFIFAIKEKGTNSILFMGLVKKPVNE